MDLMDKCSSINSELVESLIDDSVKNFFETMLDMEMVLEKAKTVNFDTKVAAPAAVGESNETLVVGNIGFVGRICGLAYIFLKNSFAQEVASRLLGIGSDIIEDEDGDEVVNDVVGELSNMVVGSFKNKLCDLGYSCKLTIPSILRGTQFTVEPVSQAQRSVFFFKCGENSLVLDILMKQADT